MTLRGDLASAGVRCPWVVALLRPSYNLPVAGPDRRTIRSVNARIEERSAKVDRWKNSNQRQRWLAVALMDIEPRLRKAMGYRQLRVLRTAIRNELKIGKRNDEKAA